MKYSFLILLMVFIFCQCRHKEENTITQFSGKPGVPQSIKKEHEQLLGKAQQFTLFHDSAGHSAQRLYDLMKHHFAEEEDYVLPPLGILPLLATGKLPGEKEEIVQLCEKLKSNLSHLSAEHQLIKAFVKELLEASTVENRSEIVAFENELQKHASAEEEVFFPASVLIGEYLKLKHEP